MEYTLKEISVDVHTKWVIKNNASYLQLPNWAGVKKEWNHKSIGWYNHKKELVCAVLLLTRNIPKTNKKLAYIPEGPHYFNKDINKLLKLLEAHLQNCFALIIGPRFIIKKWDKDKIKNAIADNSIQSIEQVKPTFYNENAAEYIAKLQSQKFTQIKATDTFNAGQPKYVFYLPLIDKQKKVMSDLDVLKKFNQLWRRNIKKSIKENVKVVIDNSKIDDFYSLYLETAKRDNFIPRPKKYIQTFLTELSNYAKLFTAYKDDVPIASTIAVQVGNHNWYAYGASSGQKEYRNYKGSNAVQWAMIKDAIAQNASVYDMRGVTVTVDKNNPLIGLINFKVATGGEMVSYIGEFIKVLDKKTYGLYNFFIKIRRIILKFGIKR